MTERLNRILHFDDKAGVLRAESGVTLAELLRLLVPRGWFLPVTPGTKFVSLGGCVASDVHGKNHHRDGSFGAHVLEVSLVLADGSRRRCSRLESPELFWATVGGMGLTGIIAEVAIRLIPIWTSRILVRHLAAKDLESVCELLGDPRWDDKYSVAWIDSLAGGRNLGRGVVMLGHHADPAELGGEAHFDGFQERGLRNLPPCFPSWALNPWSVRAFNDLYYRLEGRKAGPFPAGLDEFFYPLDRIGNWNRLYGKRGFVQYQCLIPAAQAGRGLRHLMEEAIRGGCCSYLSVLKKFGKEGPGFLSFPGEGYTLTMDIPLTGPEVFACLDRLDEIVLRYGGRVNLSKDARLSARSFAAMYPRLRQWREVKRSVDPGWRFSSSMSRRLELDAP